MLLNTQKNANDNDLTRNQISAKENDLIRPIQIQTPVPLLPQIPPSMHSDYQYQSNVQSQNMILSFENYFSICCAYLQTMNPGYSPEILRSIAYTRYQSGYAQSDIANARFQPIYSMPQPPPSTSKKISSRSKKSQFADYSNPNIPNIQLPSSNPPPKIKRLNSYDNYSSSQMDQHQYVSNRIPNDIFQSKPIDHSLSLQPFRVDSNEIQQKEPFSYNTMYSNSNQKIYPNSNISASNDIFYMSQNNPKLRNQVPKKTGIATQSPQSDTMSTSFTHPNSSLMSIKTFPRGNQTPSITVFPVPVSTTKITSATAQKNEILNPLKIPFSSFNSSNQQTGSLNMSTSLPQFQIDTMSHPIHQQISKPRFVISNTTPEIKYSNDNFPSLNSHSINDQKPISISNQSLSLDPCTLR